MKKSFFDLQWFSIWLMILAVGNFAVFGAIASHIGGDALTGYKENGKHYLGNHGTSTEVSAIVYKYSKIHGALSILLVISAFIVMIVAFQEKKREEREQRAEKRTSKLDSK